MKKIFSIILLLTTFIYSCEDMDFIQPEPQDRITIELALADLSGVQAVIASAYNRLINFQYYGQRMMIAPDALADNVIVGNNTGRYTGEQVNQARAHMDIWNDPANPNPAGYTVRSAYNAYRTINDCNIALDALSKLTILPDDEALANRLEGEALFIRALSYHDLARIYSYEPGKEVNGWNQGVVIRTEAVFGAAGADLRPRSSNVEVYEQIESDLLAAISLLPTEANTTTLPYRASSTAATALLARVYLYWGRYADAATRADQALGATTATLATAANYPGIWTATRNPESLFELRVDLVDWNTVDGVNNSLVTVSRSGAAGGTVPSGSQGATRGTEELLAAHEPGDVRRTLWSNPSSATFFECAKWNGEAGDYRENIPLIRYSEVLLIAAEAKARSGNEAGAITDLNRLRTNRGLTETALTGQDLLNLILNERRVELCLEGHRFFDLKRLGLDITKPVNTPTLLYSDFRILAPLDPDYLSINTTAEDNPGY